MDIMDSEVHVVKRLMKKRLVQNNLFMLLLFVLLIYCANNGYVFSLIVILCVLIIGGVFLELYTFMTDKYIGKTNRRVQAFMRKHLGEKRWRRGKITQIVLLVIVSIIILFILFLFVIFDFTEIKFDSPFDTLPYLGAWVGINIGEIYRINKLTN